MAMCEKCAALECENEVLRKRLAVYDKYGELLDNHLGALVQSATEKQRRFFNIVPGEKASINACSRLAEAQAAVNDRLFAQLVMLFELPLKTEQMQAKTENLRTRTAQVEADARLKGEKIKGLQADRALKEHQTQLIGAATRALERYANTGNMVDADFEVIDQLKEIGVKIPAKIQQKI